MSIEFIVNGGYGSNDDKNTFLTSYEIKDLLRQPPPVPHIDYLHHPELWTMLDEDDE
jgi:hypothetical protein